MVYEGRMVDGRRVYSTAEAAARNGISPATIRQWVKRGHLKPVLDAGGRGHYFDSEDVFDAKRRNEVPPDLKPAPQVDLKSADLDALITGPEAARLMGMSPSTIRMWVKRGHLAPAKTGSRPLYRVRDVLATAKR